MTLGSGAIRLESLLPEGGAQKLAIFYPPLK